MSTKHIQSTSSRIISFDLARGFTVLFMPMIHTVMLMSLPEVQQSVLGAILTFIAEGPGAQIFMLLMGVVFTLKQSALKQSFKKVLSRSITLLITAYLLNYAKFILPFSLGLMPEPLLKELGLDPNRPTEVAIFFIGLGDILQFAAIAQLILWGVSKSRYSHIIAAILSIAILFLSPYLWDRGTGIPWIDYFFGLFVGHPPNVFFPVFPWIVYPLIGFTLGHAIKTKDKDTVLKRSAIIGTALILISLSLPYTPPNTLYLEFYRTRPADSIFHIGIVLLWLQIFNWLSKKIKHNPFFVLLTFCSKNITAIYVVQWAMICWCMCYTGYLTQGFLATLTWMTGITTTTLLLTYILKKYATRKSI